MKLVALIMGLADGVRTRAEAPDPDQFPHFPEFYSHQVSTERHCAEKTGFRCKRGVWAKCYVYRRNARAARLVAYQLGLFGDHYWVKADQLERGFQWCIVDYCSRSGQFEEWRNCVGR